ADTIVKELGENKIPCYGIQWPEAYEEKAYREHNGFGTTKFPFESKEYADPASVQYDKVLCPKAKSLRDETLSLFLHPTWEEVHIQRCIDGFKAVIEKHLK
ncbi:MAG: DegT/DnrJ/EryC1/StrS family aminotransferase, partial [Clostridia bacterium]|nr:DegT/DnrJ/EryC1/StrS family aminotransferase [Clostridia bacterium]